MLKSLTRGFARTGRLSLVLVATAAALVLGIASGGPSQAAETFDPGQIISDETFYKSSAMTVGEIEAFIVGKGANCVPGKDGSLCLKTFRQDTTSRAATAKCTSPYVGTGNESAAQIIAKVSSACGINPQVLLVMLQKEQGLVTASGTGLTLSRYQKAMGYACPDTAPCDVQYYGFQNQVYSAAAQLKSYALTPNSWNHRAGVVNNIRFHPNAACGTSAVFIQNQATASLYNYTPYQPNAAALAAGSGTGDTCSSYGNRNFYNYFKLWFGEPLNQAPIGTVDSVTVSGSTLTVTGWTLDRDTTSAIEAHIYIDGVGVSIMADRARPDLIPAYDRGANHGFSYSVAVGPGTHNVCVFGINATPGANTLLDCRNVAVADAAPLGEIGAVTTTPSSLTVSGWALDPDTSAPIEAHIYVDGQGVSIMADGPRPDLVPIYNRGANHGYSWTFKVGPGTHNVCVYGINSTPGPNTLIGCRTVSIANAAPIGVIDSVTTTASTLSVAGWTLDPDTSVPIEAHIYVDGQGVSIMADAPRPDLIPYYNRGADHGYGYTFQVGPGTHNICVYGIDATAGPNTVIGCRTVSIAAVADIPPVGVLDSVGTSPGSVTFTGWALDPDTSESIETHIYVDGVGVSILANGPRPDLIPYYNRGAAHGFSYAWALAPGRHSYCLYAISGNRGANSTISCGSVDVP